MSSPTNGNRTAPADVSPVVTPALGQWPPGEAKKTPSQPVIVVGTVYWRYGGAGWRVRYSLSANERNSLWILWSQETEDDAWWPSWEGPGALHSATPLAWCLRPQLTRREAAFLLLRAWWSNLRDREQGSLGEVEEGALLSEHELLSLAQELWPP
jgi:hypothetical protein